jgi:GDPmannose 4,6-dehydratase
MPRALVTGVRGQDGHYLTRLLLSRGYEVVGISRSALSVAPAEGLSLRNVDITEPSAMKALFDDWTFDEIYNLAGESYGPASWEFPVETTQTLGVAVIRILELIRASGRATRFFQASSSELFGQTAESPQRETTSFQPSTPYGLAKWLAHRGAGLYRERHGVFVSCGILFNHESPLRSASFVTRKITQEVARIHAGLSSGLTLGSLAARRDWGFAGDSAEGMWRMLQAQEPGDFVLATGESHSVRELCEIAFGHAGLDYRQYVREQPELMRAGDFDHVGDPAKARRILGWRTTVSFRELITMMVDEDLKQVKEQTMVED